jgi:hypothetical protein
MVVILDADKNEPRFIDTLTHAASHFPRRRGPGNFQVGLLFSGIVEGAKGSGVLLGELAITNCHKPSDENRGGAGHCPVAELPEGIPPERPAA